MNFARLFSQPDFSHVNGWAVLLTFFAAFFGGYLGVRLAAWVKKKDP